MTDPISDQKAVSTQRKPHRQASWAAAGTSIESGLVGLLRRLRRGHWGLALYRIAWRFPGWMFRCNQATLMRSPVRSLLHRVNSQHVLSFAAQADLKEISEITNHPVDELSRRLLDGGECLITRDSSSDNQIVNVQWMHSSSTYVKGLGFEVAINPDSAYTYGSFTVPSYRMKGVFQRALHETNRVQGDRGVSIVYCLIERANSASYSSHIRLGYEPVTRISHLVLFGLKITVTRDCATGRRRFRLFLNHPQDCFSI